MIGRARASLPRSINKASLLADSAQLACAFRREASAMQAPRIDERHVLGHLSALSPLLTGN